MTSHVELRSGRAHEIVEEIEIPEHGGEILPVIVAVAVIDYAAVSLAVEKLHPEVNSVVELGGQDAKIIIFKESKDSDGKTAIASMNDKCASGTGATIDKCFLKVNAPPELVTTLRFDDSKLHHVAAKCGVFAETDIVNLIKSGIPSTEVLCSLADAIVMHCLPAYRGKEIEAEVLDGPRSVVIREAFNRMVVQMAVLYRLLRG